MMDMDCSVKSPQVKPSGGNAENPSYHHLLASRLSYRLSKSNHIKLPSVPKPTQTIPSQAMADIPTIQPNHKPPGKPLSPLPLHSPRENSPAHPALSPPSTTPQSVVQWNKIPAENVTHKCRTSAPINPQGSHDPPCAHAQRASMFDAGTGKCCTIAGYVAVWAGVHSGRFPGARCRNERGEWGG